MKKWWVIGIIAIVILVLIIIGMYFLLNLGGGKNDCSTYEPVGCNVQCNRDSDCKNAGNGCFCINNYQDMKIISGSQVCESVLCSCKNNICINSNPQYSCPTNTGYINCMPSPDAMKENTVCHGEYHNWVVKNCPDVKFAV